jgi:hypothetical protein
MKFLNKQEKTYKWIKVGSLWIGNGKKKNVSIKLQPGIVVGAKDKYMGFANEQAGMGIEKNGKPMLNSLGKQMTYPDYNIYISSESLEEE